MPQHLSGGKENCGRYAVSPIIVLRDEIEVISSDKTFKDGLEVLFSSSVYV